MTAPAPPFFPIPSVQLAPDDVPPPAWPGPPPPVIVYGDSFTQGKVGIGGIGSANWTVRVNDQLRLAIGNDGVGGSGFVAVSHGSTFPYAGTVWGVADAKVALIFGGYNDMHYGQDPAAVQLAVVVALAAIAASSPRAARVLVGPQWPATTPTQAILDMRDAIAAGAAQVPGVTYVDATLWFQGRANLIGSDGLHPTDAGHAYIADRMAPIITDALAVAG